MGEKHAKSMTSFLDTGIDLSTDELSPEESRAFLNWNARVHGTNDLSLAAFATTRAARARTTGGATCIDPWGASGARRLHRALGCGLWGRLRP
jgi:hypothetical protein